MKNKDKFFGLYNLFLLLFGGFIGALLSSHFSRILYFFAGIFGGIILSCLYSCREKSLTVNKTDINAECKTDTPINENMEEIEHTLHMRTAACERMRLNEFWIQIINIYYSCFTAVLAICSLCGDNEFIDIPSAIFTVVVALLVTFANSQKYGDRANDLKANCIDIKRSLNQCRMLGDKTDAKNSGADGMQCRYDENDRKALEKIMEEYFKKLGDSENSGIAEKWKFGKPHDLYKYYIYISLKILLILIFLSIPVIFVFLYRAEFINIFIEQGL